MLDITEKEEIGKEIGNIIQTNNRKQTIYNGEILELLKKNNNFLPIFSGDRENIKDLQTYLIQNKKKIEDFIENQHIISKELLFDILLQTNNTTYYQKQTLKYIETRIKNNNVILYYTLEDLINENHSEQQDGTIYINLVQVFLVSAISNISFEKSLALCFIHECNHIFFNFRDNYLSTKELRQKEVYHKLEQYYKDFLQYNKKNNYTDLFRNNNDYIKNNFDEFLTESVSNEHFMKYLSQIKTSDTHKSKFDTIIKNNLSKSGIKTYENSILYTILDIYYTNINNKNRELHNDNDKKIHKFGKTLIPKKIS